MVRIDTSKLHPGMIVKNYKELCKILGIEFPNGGTVKRKQLKEIEYYIFYQKSGYSYIIKEVYDKKTLKLTPSKSRDKRYKNPRNIYTRYISQILLQVINNCSEKQFSNVTFKDICVLLGLVEIDNNEKYVFKNTDGTTLEMTQEQRTLSIQKMESILKSAITSLVNKGYITCQHTERRYTFSFSASINVINLSEMEVQREKQMLHEEFILFITNNYLRKEAVNDTSN